MTPTIEQSVTFNASARQLYDIYLDHKRHSEFTGGPVTISPKPGSAFDAFGGMLTGTMLATIPGKLIVQRWRSMKFKKTDPDSILIFYFTQVGKKGRIDMAHVNVPPQDHGDVIAGWKKYYWDPLKKYLKKGK
jgi:activator of HSP90 ATPase